MSEALSTEMILGSILDRKQQIEKHTGLKPSGVQLPYRFQFMATPDGGLSSVTHLFDLPVSYGETFALLYPIGATDV